MEMVFCCLVSSPRMIRQRNIASGGALARKRKHECQVVSLHTKGMLPAGFFFLLSLKIG